MAFKKHHKALDHMLLALAALAEGDSDTAEEQLNEAIADPDMDDALIDLGQENARVKRQENRRRRALADADVDPEDDDDDFEESSLDDDDDFEESSLDDDDEDDADGDDDDDGEVTASVSRRRPTGMVARSIARAKAALAAVEDDLGDDDDEDDDGEELSSADDDNDEWDDDEADSDSIDDSLDDDEAEEDSRKSCSGVSRRMKNQVRSSAASVAKRVAANARGLL